MKIYLDDSSDYIEIKESKTNFVDLSIRTSTENKASIIITASLDQDKVDSIIAKLISLKATKK